MPCGAESGFKNLASNFARRSVVRVLRRSGASADSRVKLERPRIRTPSSLRSYSVLYSERATSRALKVSAVALYLNRRLWPFTALNSWTGGLSIGLNSWKHCTLIETGKNLGVGRPYRPVLNDARYTGPV